MPHQGEVVRGGVHALTGALLFSMSLYNGMRYGETGARRNAVNAAPYMGLWYYEMHNTRLHWRAS